MKIEDLVHKGLPEFAVAEMAARGIDNLEPLQQQAVEVGLFEGRNLMVVAPTSSGKTLIAELAALKHIVSRSGVVLVTPYKALAYEKYLNFRDSYSRPDDLQFHTSISTGDEVSDESIAASMSLTVATYEKWFYMLLERPERITRNSLLVVDELQMLGDPYRGGTLEALLTWTRTKAPETQIIGLSATVPNIAEIAGWLGAKVVRADRRPVPLVERIWGKKGAFEVNRDDNGGLRHVGTNPRSTNTLEALTEIGPEGKPIAVFCVTKDHAENLAKEAARNRGRRPDCEQLVKELDEVSEANPATRLLRQTLPKGVAFHNANLNLDERRLIEHAFRDQKVDLLFTTPTLSAGVNLPIKTVVFDRCDRSWVPEYISTTEYLNMAGRAGRRGLQESGVSILLARTGAELMRFKGYLSGEPELIESRLAGESLDRVVLQAVAGRIAHTHEDVNTFFDRSFQGNGALGEQAVSNRAVSACLARLANSEMVYYRDGSSLAPTPLGARTAASGVLPSTGRLLFDSLVEASALFEWSSSEALEREVLLLATACPDLAPSVDGSGLLYVHKNENRTAIKEAQSAFTGLVYEDFLEDPTRSILSAIVVYRYITGASFAELKEIARYASAANVRRIAGNCGWMLQAAASIEEARGGSSNPEFRRWLSRMAKRLEYGATDQAVQLCAIARYGDVRGIGRSRAERLAKCGFNDLAALLEADIREVAECVDSRSRANQLRAAVVKYLDDKSRHNQFGHESRASEAGRDQNLISDYYLALGTDLNRAALDLLLTEFEDAREQDLGGDSEPDLAIPTSEGLLVIECKAKNSTDGTIGVEDAFAVIHKSVQLDPIARVTLGKPAFDRVPIERAKVAGVCLVTHDVFCEAIVRIWEGSLTRKSFLAALMTPGLLDKNNLDTLD